MLKALQYVNEALDYIEQTKPAIVENTRRMSGAPLNDVITRFVEIRDLHARLKAIAAGINQLADHLSYDLVPHAMERTGLTVAHHTLGRIQLEMRTSATVLNKEGAYEWLRANGKGDLIIETINAQTLGATARELIDAGDELPSNLFKTTVKTYTKLTRPGERTKKDDQNGTEN